MFYCYKWQNYKTLVVFCLFIIKSEFQYILQSRIKQYYFLIELFIWLRRAPFGVTEYVSLPCLRAVHCGRQGHAPIPIAIGIIGSAQCDLMLFHSECPPD